MPFAARSAIYMFRSCGVVLLQVPTVVEALVKGPWDPQGAIWGRQLDMALEVRAATREPKWSNDQTDFQKCAALLYVAV